MFDPLSMGPPPATNRTGLPQVWASMQKNDFIAIIYLIERLLQQPLLFANKNIAKKAKTTPIIIK